MQMFDMMGDSEFPRCAPLNSAQACAANTACIYTRIAELTPARTTQEWWALLSVAGIPAVPFRQLPDIDNDPHLEAVALFKHAEHPGREGCQKPIPNRFSAMTDFDLAHVSHRAEHNSGLERLSADKSPPGEGRSQSVAT